MEYYENEMNYLIESGKELKKQYPLMSNLDFSNDSNDPDVKKLIEGTAFLNANLQKRIDEKNVEFSQELLNSIYPYFNRPTPSVSIFQINDYRKVCVVPQYTSITSKYSNSDNEKFNFLTTSSIRTSAFEVVDIKKTSSNDLPKNVAKITDTAIEIFLHRLFDETEKEIVFYINKMEHSACLIYESLLSFFKDQPTPVFENSEQIGELDFADDQMIMPFLKNENNCYKSVIEFNVFKEKFLFFKVKLNKAPYKSIQIPIRNNKSINVSKNSFLLNCVVGVNLVEKISDPINITHKKFRYKLFIKNNTDIYSIFNLRNLNDPDQKFINYFSLDFPNKTEKDVLWYYKKDNNINSSTFLYFFDDSMEPKTIFAKMLCTQNNANEIIADNEEWNVNYYNLKASNLKKPTKYFSNSNYSDAQRKLIGHLNINYFGLDSDNTLQKLKELFHIYSNYSSSYHFLNSISDIKFENKMIPFNGFMLPKVFITLTLDSEPKAFLLARVISKLIKSTIPINKKVSLTLIKSENGEIWKEWDLN